MVVTITASSLGYRGRKTDGWVIILHRTWMQTGCGLVGLEGSHETTKTLEELVYRLNSNPAPPISRKSQKLYSLSQLVPALNVMSVKPSR